MVNSKERRVGMSRRYFTGPSLHGHRDKNSSKVVESRNESDISNKQSFIEAPPLVSSDEDEPLPPPESKTKRAAAADSSDEDSGPPRSNIPKTQFGKNKTVPAGAREQPTKQQIRSSRIVDKGLRGTLSTTKSKTTVSPSKRKRGDVDASRSDEDDAVEQVELGSHMRTNGARFLGTVANSRSRGYGGFGSSQSSSQQKRRQSYGVKVTPKKPKAGFRVSDALSMSPEPDTPEKSAFSNKHGSLSPSSPEKPASKAAFIRHGSLSPEKTKTKRVFNLSSALSPEKPKRNRPFKSDANLSPDRTNSSRLKFQSQSDIEDSPLSDPPDTPPMKPGFVAASPVASPPNEVAIKGQAMQASKKGDQEVPSEINAFASSLDVDQDLKSLGLDLADTEDQDDSLLALKRDLKARCPICSASVDPQLLNEYTRKGPMTWSRRQQFCKAHKQLQAEKDWNTSGYPEIEWETLDSRIARHYTVIRNLITKGHDSFYRSRLEDIVNRGQDRTLKQTVMGSGLQLPGYYGSRGLRVMSENLMQKFAPQLRTSAIEDRLVSARGVTAYVQSVLVPELTVLLIKEDMDVGTEEARKIMVDSSALGDILNEEEEDVITRRSDDDESEEDEWA